MHSLKRFCSNTNWILAAPKPISEELWITRCINIRLVPTTANSPFAKLKSSWEIKHTQTLNLLWMTWVQFVFIQNWPNTTLGISHGLGDFTRAARRMFHVDNYLLLYNYCLSFTWPAHMMYYRKPVTPSRW